MTTREILGEKLARIRERAGISQLKLGRLLGYTNGQFVSNWENGRSRPSLHKLNNIFTIIKIKPHEKSEVLKLIKKDLGLEDL